MNIGMNAQDGTALSDIDHLRQSISQILTTPVGSRVMRRSFGSLLPELLDHPLNEHTTLQLYAATATALLLHEPRLRLTDVSLQVGGTSGRATLDIAGVTTVARLQRRVSISVPLQQRI